MSAKTLSTAATPTMAAITARTVSSVPTVRGAEGRGMPEAGALAGAGAGDVGRETAVPGRAVAAAGAAGAAVGG